MTLLLFKPSKFKVLDLVRESGRVSLSIIMPAYNEGKEIYSNLKSTVRALDSYFRSKKMPYEIVVVDDGSSDNTDKETERAISYNPRIKLVKMRQNEGKGAAIKQGYMHTRGQYVAFLDADLDIPPTQIATFYDYMQKKGCDVVIGSKRNALSEVDYPLKRRALSSAYNLLVRILFNLRVSDTQAGLKLFKRRALEKVMSRILCKRFAYDVELLVCTKKHGYSIEEAPIKLNWHRVSSRIRMMDAMHILWDTAAIFYRLHLVGQYD